MTATSREMPAEQSGNGFCSAASLIWRSLLTGNGN
jgi:hypothetical protein